MTPLELLFFGQVAFASLALFPFFVHEWLNRKWLVTHPLPSHPDVTADELPKMVVAICVRNEEMVIAGKLSDLAKSGYPREKLEILVVDTGSSDSTMQVVEKWIADSPELGPRIRLLSTTALSGKSAAVNLALAECEADSEVFTLTDADSRLTTGALERLGGWFLNPAIGAVCGRQIPVGSDGIPLADASGYRAYYNRAREAESRLDSTLVFEGSLAAYRRVVINAGVVADANADDSQLALETRKQGLRAIHDPDLHFYEAIPTSLRAIHSQRARRAQGLVGHIWRNKEMLLHAPLGGAMRMNMRSLFFLHVLMPFLATLALFCTIAALVATTPQLNLASGVPTDFTSFIRIVNLGFLLVVFIPPLISTILRHHLLRPMPLPTSFVHAMLILTWVHVRIGLGFQSHIWRPIQEIRVSISKFDRAN